MHLSLPLSAVVRVPRTIGVEDLKVIISRYTEGAVHTLRIFKVCQGKNWGVGLCCLHNYSRLFTGEVMAIHSFLRTVAQTQGKELHELQVGPTLADQGIKEDDILRIEAAVRGGSSRTTAGMAVTTDWSDAFGMEG